jgi:AAA domain/Bifunctional DNA primase/polymerase, N-terminal
MSCFLDIALPLAERGFNVFPLIPNTKMPLASPDEYDHFDTATTDAEQIKAWGKQKPNANVAISPDEIWCFLETDDEAALKAACADLPPDIWDTARVSARENRCYYIYRQTARTRRAVIRDKALKREGAENLCEFKAFRTYVTGPGSIHPKTGKPYGVEWRTIPAMPDVLLNRLCELYGAPKATDSNTMSSETGRQTALLDSFLETYEVSTMGDWFNKGKQWYRPITCPWESEHENTNQGTSTCIVYSEGAGYGFDCKHRCEAKTWKEFRTEVQGRFPDRKFSFVEQTTAAATIGSASEPVKDWRERYLTFERVRDAKPVEFLIEGFLALDSITALAAPVGQRKSLIAMNVAHALCTGEPLFDYFKVVKQPSRVVYLCPEMGLSSFSTRLKQIGLASHVGQNLFCQTMDEESIKLTDLDEELPGSVVIIDTLTRFVEGDQNSSEDMSRFAKVVFALKRRGATIVLLHHSIKGASTALTLDSAMRGSTELAAFVTCCWATRLQDVNDPYNSPSLLVNVKQRDFESKPFEATSDKSCRMRMVGEPGQVTSTRVDAGAEAVLSSLLKDSPKAGINKLQEGLRAAGHKKGVKWVTKTRGAILGTGVTTSS